MPYPLEGIWVAVLYKWLLERFLKLLPKVDLNFIKLNKKDLQILISWNHKA